MISTGKRYAIKLVSKQVTADKRRQFMTERVILGRYSAGCPFMVQLHSSFQTKLHCYTVMELIEGGTLHQRLKIVGNFRESVTEFYMAEIGLAVFYLHDNGILHRDLRLQNVMIKRDGHIRLIDFCLSKMSMKDKFTDTVGGNLKEMAPEMHHHSLYNKAVDYWGMGVMLYTMLHGQPPFTGKTRVELFMAITMKTEAYSNALRPHTVALCKSLLKKNQKKRLGYEQSSHTQMMKHDFFKNVQWYRMKRRLYTPPYVPMTRDPQQLAADKTWPTLSEQNIVFAGGVPNRLSHVMNPRLLAHKDRPFPNPSSFLVDRLHAAAWHHAQARNASLSDVSSLGPPRDGHHSRFSTLAAPKVNLSNRRESGEPERTPSATSLVPIRSPKYSSVAHGLNTRVERMPRSTESKQTLVINTLKVPPHPRSLSPLSPLTPLSGTPLRPRLCSSPTFSPTLRTPLTQEPNSVSSAPELKKVDSFTTKTFHFARPPMSQEDREEVQEAAELRSRAVTPRGWRCPGLLSRCWRRAKRVCQRELLTCQRVCKGFEDYNTPVIEMEHLLQMQQQQEEEEEEELDSVLNYRLPCYTGSL